MIVLGADSHKRSHTIAAVSVKAGRKVDHLRRLKSDPLRGLGIGCGKRPSLRRLSP
jgi:hypothetical protein